MLLTQVKPETALTIKKYGYFIYLLPLFIPAMSYYLGNSSDNAFWWTLLAPFIVYVIVPIFDLILGKDPVNPEADDEKGLSQESFYKWLTVSCLPLYFITLISTAYFLMEWKDLTTAGQLAYIYSMGLVGAIIAINVGHELVHKNTKLEQISGGLLLSLVSYGGFKIEHVYGHHVHVSTPEDASSSRFNENVYSFVPKAVVRNFINAWKLQKKRLQKKGCGLLSIKNELIWYYLFSATVCVGLGFFFQWMGGEFWMGVGYFLGQSAVAFISLEIINYIEHYGLHRRKMSNGKYERVTPEHSWNSNYFLTNMFLFQLQRHSDHHAYAARRYQILRHYDDSPQLPFGYATMYVIALIPPLWKAIMNPRVEAYYQDDKDALGAH